MAEYRKLDDHEDDDDAMLKKHQDLLVSGIINTRSRGATYTGLSMFNDDLSSLLQLPRPSGLASGAIAGARAGAVMRKTADDGGAGGFDPDDLRSRAFAEVPKNGGGVGYVTRQAYDLLLPALLFFVLGFAPFGIINGMWSQLAVLRNYVPEGTQIGTIVGSVYNVANIFPFIYVFLNRFVKCADRVVIPVIIMFGIAVAFVLAFFWKTKMTIAGHEISVVIYVCSFLAGGVGCMLGLIMYNYIARFRPFATTAFSFGMGISSTVLSGLALLQTIGLPNCYNDRNAYCNAIDPSLKPSWCPGPDAKKSEQSHCSSGDAMSTSSTSTSLSSSSSMMTTTTMSSSMSTMSSAPPTLAPNFEVQYFFIISAALVVLSLGAFLFIDCCKTYMAPHEDPDFFFRDVDKSRAEEEEERRQAAAAAAAPDDDDQVQLDADGKVRFSLTLPLQSPSSTPDGDADLPLTAPINNTDAADGGGGGSSAMNDSGVPAIVVVKPQSTGRRLFGVAFMPVFDQFLKSAMVYCIAPGMTQYLTQNSTVVSWIIFAANFSNMLGRISTGFLTIWKLWILNLICLALFVYEFLVASWCGSFPVTQWLLIPITVVSSFLSGYVSTQVYMCANRAVIRAFHGDTTHAKSVRSYVSLANQVGMLVGTYGCLLVSSLGVFTSVGK